jgi:hypothetical protein
LRNQSRPPYQSVSGDFDGFILFGMAGGKGTISKLTMWWKWGYLCNEKWCTKKRREKNFKFESAKSCPNYSLVVVNREWSDAYGTTTAKILPFADLGSPPPVFSGLPRLFVVLF